jgi:hypothetical protein
MSARSGVLYTSDVKYSLSPFVAAHGSSDLFGAERDHLVIHKEFVLFHGVVYYIYIYIYI